MKKNLIIPILTLSLTFATPIFSQPKNLGKAAEDARNEASRNQWRSWLLATGAVVLATIGLIYIGTHKGHSSNTVD